MFQVAERVVDFSVFGLVGSDVIEETSHASVALGHAPILNREIRSFEIGIGPFGQVSIFEILDRERVGEDGFFFEIADEAVAGLGGEEVAEEEGIEEDALGAEDHGAHEETWFVHLEEG